MATGKPRFSITVSDDVYQQINEYQHEHRLSTQTKAVVAFIEKGLEVIQKEKHLPTGIIEVESLQEQELTGDAFFSTERSHIKKYRSLDPYGKEAVDGVLDVEWRRCTQLPQETAQESEAIYFIVPAFLSALSAGTGQPILDDSAENYRLTKEPPRGTSYIACVSGDSMEPTYHDGDRLFIRACTEIEPGQIGVFFMDGQQWVKELGDGELISHNSDYLPRPMTEDIRCQGLVLGVCDDSYFE